ncbi:MAG: PEP/pyruvate-binding domain-containing protein [Desulfuromonadales bacterium]|nr:PEP/pyruvate-binding domain-containing protein [Desulfuromonadales bacterium]
MDKNTRVSTGIPGLDNILDGLRIGDNVVWRVDSIADYKAFVTPYVREALQNGRRVVYMRFGRHEPLVVSAPNVVTYQLDAVQGFESFASRVHAIATEEGRYAFYVFDCLSDLLSAWATDQVIGNFFQVTCPYLFELDTVAYFALMRGSHSFKTTARIRETTQVMIGVHTWREKVHVHPIKVWQRHSPTMFLPHAQTGENFLPVAGSFEATELLSSISRRGTESGRRQLDYWDRLFLQAEDLITKGSQPEERAPMVDQLCRVMIGREDRILSLARAYLTLEDLLGIKARMIGTGFVGGKAAGMLLARRILLADGSFDWKNHLEQHDSFFVGSDVYYSYIVHNGWWKLLMQQKTDDGYFSVAAELREKMRQGEFPEEIREAFQQMLEYFGQYPIIVRSSSLLEDGFGNAFAGKYDSYFLANQGSPEERCARLEEVVRAIFASTMGEDALAYRRQRGLDRLEEQMGLLIQRVSGSYRNHYYFPDLAGVGVSYNTFVWSKEMDPKAGMLRLVAGLGTRAVDRVEGDYPRIVALDAPLKRPLKGFEDARRFAQRDVDLINVESNRPETVSLLDLFRQELGIDWSRYAVPDWETTKRLEERGGKGQKVWLLTFDTLLSEGPFTGMMQRMLKTIEGVYRYPVDVEFTVNFDAAGTPVLNVVQCRPLQTKGEAQKVDIPQGIIDERVFFSTEGHFMGGSIAQTIRRIILVDSEEYIRLPLTEKYEVARLIGRLNKRLGDRREVPTLLMGPGRWGTSTPSLGVPVTFAELNNITALAEVAFPGGNLMPELSFGTHFFQDLVEADIFYVALFPDSEFCTFNREWLEELPNALEGIMPASGRYKKVVKVYNLPGEGLQLMADVVSQRLLCYR